MLEVGHVAMLFLFTMLNTVVLEIFAWYLICGLLKIAKLDCTVKALFYSCGIN